MVIEMLILFFVVLAIRSEANKIKAEVENIQKEAEMIRDKIRHPLETLGGTLGRKLDGEIESALGGN